MKKRKKKGKRGKLRKELKMTRKESKGKRK